MAAIPHLALSSTLQHVAETKLTKLAQRRAELDEFLRENVDDETVNFRDVDSVRRLFEAMRQRGHRFNDQDWPDFLTNFLDQAEKNSYIRSSQVVGWGELLILELEQKKNRYQVTELFSKLVLQWIQSPVAGQNLTDDSESAQGLSELREQLATWTSYAFEEKHTDKTEIMEYLNELFLKKQQRSALSESPFDQLRQAIAGFNEIKIDKKTVRAAVIALLKEDLFAGEKRDALQDLKLRDVVMEEIADALRSDLSALDRWSWQSSPIPVHFRRHINGKFRDYNDDSDDNESNDMSPSEIKQSMLRLITAEILIQKHIHGSATYFQTDFKWFGPSVPHSSLLALFEFFHVPPKWFGFFKEFLQPTLQVQAEGAYGEPKKRVRGIPISHTLSTAFGELLLFVLDYAVNQETQGCNIYRFFDDIHFWGQPESCVKAWNTIKDFTRIMGLTLNEEKSGSFQCGTNGENTKLPNSLPTGDVHWGFMKLVGDGEWQVDHENLMHHISEMARQLKYCNSVLDVISFLREKIQAAKEFQSVSFDLSDAFFFFPTELGGLCLSNPLDHLINLRREFHRDPENIVLSIKVKEKQEYEKAFQNFEEGMVHGIPSNAPDTPLSFEDYCKFPEDGSQLWNEAYKELQDEIDTSYPMQTHDLESAKDFVECIDQIEIPAQHSWSIQMYGAEVLTHMGRLAFGERDLMPLALIKNMKSEANWTSPPPMENADHKFYDMRWPYNLSHFLKQAEWDPFIRPSQVAAWGNSLLLELEQKRARYDATALFSKLVLQWIKNPVSVPNPMDETESSPRYLELEQQRDTWKSYAFEEKVTDKAEIFEYLDNFDEITIDKNSIRVALRALLKKDLFVGEKRSALEDLQSRDIVLDEIADALRSDLNTLESWSWQAHPIPVHFRKNINGRFRVYLDEEIYQAIFIQIVGTFWAVFLKRELKRFVSSSAWLEKRPTTKLNREHIQKRINLMGENRESSRRDYSINNSRWKTYRDVFFLSDEDDPDEHIKLDTLTDVKQRILRLISTEILLRKQFYGSATYFQTDIKWFGPSIPHTTLLTVFEFFHVPPKWMAFFREFLQPTLQIEEGEICFEPKKRVRGIPMSHTLSTAFGALLLFVLDYAVNQHTQGFYNPFDIPSFDDDPKNIVKKYVNYEKQEYEEDMERFDAGKVSDIPSAVSG
ncbi:hypothetical protein MCAP1_003378 [Malassezia caprae]|uniref:Reverse transcriptase domain-containing protein n=1 Tax=Malassezia caprae TaxID=1381934 RepID=A0AAF0EEB6_9BASI|nr:hypothetical protein MCAP1_003378 [Malassezia caprae]